MKGVRRIVSVVAAIALLLIAEQAQAGLRLVVGVRVPPPPPRRELVEVRHRAGEMRISGHWCWSPMVGRHVWVPGMWVEQRHGLVWVNRHRTRIHHRWMFTD